MTATALVTGPAPHGPVADFLTDPTAFWAFITRTVLGWAAPYMPVLVPVTTAAAVCVTTARGRMRHRRQRRFADDARCVEILAPPQIPAKGGDVLWAQLAGLLRPWWRRLTDGQPHLGFEYAWSPTGLGIRLWVPGTVPLGLVRRAVEAAWPGAHTRVQQPPELIPPGHVVTAGRLRPARPEVLPLRTEHAADPLRAVLQAATGMSEGETALVQILVRPATGAAVRRARRTARRLKAGGSAPRLARSCCTGHNQY